MVKKNLSANENFVMFFNLKAEISQKMLKPKQSIARLRSSMPQS